MHSVASAQSPGHVHLGLPDAAIHPLPTSLQDLSLTTTDDYFDLIETSSLGYLIWSEFPVTVYLDIPQNLAPTSAEAKRLHIWTTAIKTAIADWQQFFPLAIVTETDQADIHISYREPPLNRKVDPETGLITFGRARTAQTRYEFYWSDETPSRLRHRMAIDIKPGLSELSLQATARHELGHGLGIWGHSDRQADALYPSQTRDVPPISPRDLKTLWRIYQQPTRLGWPALSGAE
ncbi:MAG: matrixin family metalloprotease [Synechocystis sp.]|nr:matrixin family metalloprotease [Synechocystis sp.]